MASVSGSATQGTKTQAIVTFVPKSSFIALLEYDQTNLTLTTHMMKGGIYQHKFVVPLDWEGLQTAQNHGKHWSQQIKGKKLGVKVRSAKAPNSEKRRKG
jgi:hypothetical protein